MLLSNKHTSGSALVFAFGAGLSQIGPIWFPAYTNQFSATGKFLQDIAFVYGMLMAGDASQSVTKDDLTAITNKPNQAP